MVKSINFNQITIQLKIRINVFSLPWDQETLIGYIGMICCYLIAAGVYLIISAAFFILFISLCLHQQAFYEIFRHKLAKFEKKQNDKKLLFEVIEFHNSVKE